MKKYKLHFISIFIITIMLIFALGTSPSENIELMLYNNTSQILRLKIARHQHDEYTENILLLIGESKRLNKFFVGRSWIPPEELKISIIIYNESNVILKEFNENNITELTFITERKRKGGFLGGTSYYYLKITDKLLE